MTSVNPLFMKLCIPNGLEELLEGLAREVLRRQPSDIHSFAAVYFNKLLGIRTKAKNSGDDINLKDLIGRGKLLDINEESFQILNDAKLPETEMLHDFTIQKEKSTNALPTIKEDNGGKVTGNLENGEKQNNDTNQFTNSIEDDGSNRNVLKSPSSIISSDDDVIYSKVIDDDTKELTMARNRTPIQNILIEENEIDLDNDNMNNSETLGDFKTENNLEEDISKEKMGSEIKRSKPLEVQGPSVESYELSENSNTENEISCSLQQQLETNEFDVQSTTIEKENLNTTEKKLAIQLEDVGVINDEIMNTTQTSEANKQDSYIEVPGGDQQDSVKDVSNERDQEAPNIADKNEDEEQVEDDVSIIQEFEKSAGSNGDVERLEFLETIQNNAVDQLNENSGSLPAIKDENTISDDSTDRNEIEMSETSNDRTQLESNGQTLSAVDSHLQDSFEATVNADGADLGKVDILEEALTEQSNNTEIEYKLQEGEGDVNLDEKLGVPQSDSYNETVILQHDSVINDKNNAILENGTADLMVFEVNLNDDQTEILNESTDSSDDGVTLLLEKTDKIDEVAEETKSREETKEMKEDIVVLATEEVSGEENEDVIEKLEDINAISDINDNELETTTDQIKTSEEENQLTRQTPDITDAETLIMEQDGRDTQLQPEVPESTKSHLQDEDELERSSSNSFDRLEVSAAMQYPTSPIIEIKTPFEDTAQEKAIDNSPNITKEIQAVTGIVQENVEEKISVDSLARNDEMIEDSETGEEWVNGAGVGAEPLDTYLQTHFNNVLSVENDSGLSKPNELHNGFMDEGFVSAASELNEHNNVTETDVNISKLEDKDVEVEEFRINNQNDNEMVGVIESNTKEEIDETPFNKVILDTEVVVKDKVDEDSNGLEESNEILESEATLNTDEVQDGLDDNNKVELIDQKQLLSGEDYNVALTTQEVIENVDEDSKKFDSDDLTKYEENSTEFIDSKVAVTAEVAKDIQDEVREQLSSNDQRQQNETVDGIPDSDSALTTEVIELKDGVFVEDLALKSTSDDNNTKTEEVEDVSSSELEKIQNDAVNLEMLEDGIPNVESDNQEAGNHLPPEMASSQLGQIDNNELKGEILMDILDENRAIDKLTSETEEETASSLQLQSSEVYKAPLLAAENEDNVLNQSVLDEEASRESEKNVPVMKDSTDDIPNSVEILDTPLLNESEKSDHEIQAVLNESLEGSSNSVQNSGEVLDKIVSEEAEEKALKPQETLNDLPGNPTDDLPNSVEILEELLPKESKDNVQETQNELSENSIEGIQDEIVIPEDESGEGVSVPQASQNELPENSVEGIQDERLTTDDAEENTVPDTVDILDKNIAKELDLHDPMQQNIISELTMDSNDNLQDTVHNAENSVPGDTEEKVSLLDASQNEFSEAPTDSVQNPGEIPASVVSEGPEESISASEIIQNQLLEGSNEYVQESGEILDKSLPEESVKIVQPLQTDLNELPEDSYTGVQIESLEQLPDEMISEESKENVPDLQENFKEEVEINSLQDTTPFHNDLVIDDSLEKSMALQADQDKPEENPVEKIEGAAEILDEVEPSEIIARSNAETSELHGNLIEDVVKSVETDEAVSEGPVENALKLEEVESGNQNENLTSEFEGDNQKEMIERPSEAVEKQPAEDVLASRAEPSEVLEDQATGAGNNVDENAGNEVLSNNARDDIMTDNVNHPLENTDMNEKLSDFTQVEANTIESINGVNDTSLQAELAVDKSVINKMNDDEVIANRQTSNEETVQELEPVTEIVSNEESAPNNDLVKEFRPEIAADSDQTNIYDKSLENTQMRVTDKSSDNESDDPLENQQNSDEMENNDKMGQHGDNIVIVVSKASSELGNETVNEENVNDPEDKAAETTIDEDKLNENQKMITAEVLNPYDEQTKNDVQEDFKALSAEDEIANDMTVPQNNNLNGNVNNENDIQIVEDEMSKFSEQNDDNEVNNQGSIESSLVNVDNGVKSYEEKETQYESSIDEIMNNQSEISGLQETLGNESNLKENADAAPSLVEDSDRLELLANQIEKESLGNADTFETSEEDPAVFKSDGPSKSSTENNVANGIIEDDISGKDSEVQNQRQMDDQDAVQDDISLMEKQSILYNLLQMGGNEDQSEISTTKSNDEIGESENLNLNNKTNNIQTQNQDCLKEERDIQNDVTDLLQNDGPYNPEIDNLQLETATGKNESNVETDEQGDNQDSIKHVEDINQRQQSISAKDDAEPEQAFSTLDINTSENNLSGNQAQDEPQDDDITQSVTNEDQLKTDNEGSSDASKQAGNSQLLVDNRNELDLIPVEHTTIMKDTRENSPVDGNSNFNQTSTERLQNEVNTIEDSSGEQVSLSTESHPEDSIANVDSKDNGQDIDKVDALNLRAAAPSNAITTSYETSEAALPPESEIESNLEKPSVSGHNSLKEEEMLGSNNGDLEVVSDNGEKKQPEIVAVASKSDDETKSEEMKSQSVKPDNTIREAVSTDIEGPMEHAALSDADIISGSDQEQQTYAENFTDDDTDTKLNGTTSNDVLNFEDNTDLIHLQYIK